MTDYPQISWMRYQNNHYCHQNSIVSDFTEWVEFSVSDSINYDVLYSGVFTIYYPWVKKLSDMAFFLTPVSITIEY